MSSPVSLSSLVALLSFLQLLKCCSENAARRDLGGISRDGEKRFTWTNVKMGEDESTCILCRMGKRGGGGGDRR